MKCLLVFAAMWGIIEAYLGTFPRSDQSCQDNDNSVSGYYWDGQKCEKCYDSNCFCNSYKGCTSCTSTYSAVSVSTTDMTGNPVNQPMCLKCPGSYVDQCCNPFESEPGFQFIPAQHALSLRATQCISSTSTWNYALFGSICVGMEGCQTYTNYGLCSKCMPGYYLDQNQKCQRCMNMCPASDPNCSQSKGCQSCSGPNQCDVCSPGFYMTNDNTLPTTATSFDTNILMSASYCKLCNGNCACTDANNLAIGPINSNYFFNNQTCVLCNSKDINCQNCTNDNTFTFKCTICVPGFIPNSAGKCVPCPAGCQQCQLGSGDTTSCLFNGCMNGYRLQVSTTGVNTCVKCQGNMAARCVVGSDLVSEVITQCQGNPSISASNTSAVLDAISLPPHTNDYYLVTASGSTQCVQNINSCQTIANFNGTCSSCYTDLGWQLNGNGQCVQCMSNINGSPAGSCTACVADQNNKNALICSACSSGNDVKNWGDQVWNYALSGSGSNTKCIKCNPGCLTCQSDGTCTATQCQKGYYYNTQMNMCMICPVTNCMSCNQDGTCANNGCFAGYRLWQNTNNGTNNVQTCEACDPACAQCDQSRKICTACKSGYYLFGDTCQANRANCAQMKDNGCVVCNQGYRKVDNGRCLACWSPNGGVVNCPMGCSGGQSFGNVNNGGALNGGDFTRRFRVLGYEMLSDVTQMIKDTIKNNHSFNEEEASASILTFSLALLPCILAVLLF